MIPEQFGVSRSVLSKLGVHYQEVDNGTLLFSLMDRDGAPLDQWETVFPDGRVSVPGDLFFESFIDPLESTSLFLFSSISDLVAFYQINQHRLGRGVRLASVGITTDAEAIKTYLAEQLFVHRKLKVFLAFHNDLVGRLQDIRMACWTKGQDVKISSERGCIHLSVGKYEAHLLVEQLSLSAFCKVSGFRTSLRTCKPRCANSFWDQLVHRK